MWIYSSYHKARSRMVFYYENVLSWNKDFEQYSILWHNVATIVEPLDIWAEVYMEYSICELDYELDHECEILI